MCISQRLASEAERLQREHLWQDGIKVKPENQTTECAFYLQQPPIVFILAPYRTYPHDQRSNCSHWCCPSKWDDLRPQLSRSLSARLSETDDWERSAVRFCRVPHALASHFSTRPVLFAHQNETRLTSSSQTLLCVTNTVSRCSDGFPKRPTISA